MGTRTKDFEATGIPPNGRLYAGDLNQMQDDYADLSNFSQTFDVGTIRLGEVGLQMLRYGASEARISGAVRTDGIFRGLGGLYAGAFTAAQRDAIPAGFRPYGLIILNTTANRLEVNVGTDATPDWRGVAFGTTAGEVAPGTGGLAPPGAIIPFGGSAAPSGYLLCDGQKYFRDPASGTPAYPALFAAISTGWNTGGEAATEFRVPNMQGMIPVGRDPLDAGLQEFRGAVGTGGGTKRHAMLPAEMPNHRHTVASHKHGGGLHRHVGGNHDHGGGWHDHNTEGRNTGHVHSVQASVLGYGLTVSGNQYVNQVMGIPGAAGAASLSVGGENVDHAHHVAPNWAGLTAQAPGTGDPTKSDYTALSPAGEPIASEAPLTDFVPAGGAAQGNGADHQNLQPYKLVNYIIKT